MAYDTCSMHLDSLWSRLVDMKFTLPMVVAELRDSLSFFSEAKWALYEMSETFLIFFFFK